jgi:hypothetical protein
VKFAFRNMKTAAAGQRHDLSLEEIAFRIAK